MRDTGFVTLVGAGPGDEMLITRKGFQALADCDVLVYDSLSSDAFLQYVPSSCEKIYVGKRFGHHSMKQEEINAVLVEYGKMGKKVVRLKGGDPYVFGRGGEEVLALREHKIPYEVVPGVTSAVAAPAYAGIPVTHRGMSRSFHVITGHTASKEHPVTENFETLAHLDGTLIFLMGVNHLEEITDGLRKHGKPDTTPVAIVENGTLPQQRRINGTLATIVETAKQENVKTPAIIIVGEVASHDFTENESLPLSGVKVCVTGTKRMAEKLEKRLLREGVKVYSCSYSKVAWMEENLDKPLRALNDYSWVMFTSSNGIRCFFQAVKRLQIDYRKLSHLKFAVIGSGTGEELQKYGFYVDFMPTEFTARTMAKEFSKIAGKDEKVLIPRAAKGSLEVNRILEENQIPYEDVKVYDIQWEEEQVKRTAQIVPDCDYITFESSSGVEGFFTLEEAGKLLEKTTPVCIGEVTAATLRKKGVDKLLIGKDNTIEGIIDVLMKK